LWRDLPALSSIRGGRRGSLVADWALRSVALTLVVVVVVDVWMRQLVLKRPFL